MIGIHSHLSRQIESNGQPRSSLRKQILVALVALLCCAEAGILAHGPQTAPVHIGVNAARERKFARLFERVQKNLSLRDASRLTE